MRMYHAEYESAVGHALYPGSLNVELDKPHELPADRIRLVTGAVGINLVRCRINDIPAFVFRTDKADAGSGMHAKTTVEVLAEVRLRDALDLRDGDEVRLELPE